jgi:hypothetical protein
VSLKAFYALSALLRHFPEAQHSFLRNGGLDLLKQVFEREESGSLHARLRIKILTLLHDLIGMFSRLSSGALKNKLMNIKVCCL